MPVTTHGRIVAATAALVLAVSTAACSPARARKAARPPSTSTSGTASALDSITSAEALPAPRHAKQHQHHKHHEVKPTRSRDHRTPSPSPSPTKAHHRHRHHPMPTRTAAPTPTPAPTPTRTRTHTSPPHVPPTGSVYAIGDSVMIDAQSDLYNDIRDITVNATVSRQASSGVYVVRQQKAAGTLADTTIFGLGTNGMLSSTELNELISLTAGHHLIVITSHCPYCSWTDSNNATIHQLCTPANHCAVADFQAQAEQHPEWFGGDGVHMAIGGAGAAAYAQIVANTYASFR